MLFKVATITKKLSGSTEEIKGGPTDAGITALTALNKRKFIDTPEASALGIRDLEVFDKVWGYPDVQPRLHKYINAILSGKPGSNRTKFMLRMEALEIKKMLEEKSRNNQDFFEAGEDEAVEMARPKVVSPQLRKELDLEQAEKLDKDQVKFDARNKEISQRDEAYNRRQEEVERLRKEKEIEEDRDRLLREETTNVRKATLRINELLKRYTQ